MSDLQPVGAVIQLNGEERHLLWDYGVIEKVQELYGAHPIMALESIFWEGKDKSGTMLQHFQAKPVIDIAFLLLNNEVERQKFFDGSSKLKIYTRAQVGMLITRDNASDIVDAIVQSWTGSLPEPEDDEPKNQVSE